MTVDRRFRSPAGRDAVHTAYRSLLGTHLAAVSQRTVAIGSGEAFVLSAGPTDAPPVLLLHGSGSVAGSWAPELRALSTARRVHAVDLPGEPGLSAPDRLPLQRGVHADWLREVTEVLGAPSATVAATSLGAWVAVDYALTHPERVRELVLFSPGGIGPRRVAPLVLAGLLSLLGEPGRRAALHRLLGPGQPAWDDAFHTDLGALALTTFRHFRPRTDPIPVATDRELRLLPGLLTVVLGAADRMLDGPAAAARLQKAGTPGRVVLLPGQGHLVPQDEFLDHLTGVTEPQGAPQSRR